MARDMDTFERLYRTRTRHRREKERFAQQHAKRNEKAAGSQGPKVVTYCVDSSDANKHGQVGDLRHRGTSRNALGGFFTS